MRSPIGHIRLAALVLASLLAGCAGEDDSRSGSTTGTTAPQREGSAEARLKPQRRPDGAGSARKRGDSRPFVPRPHHDSGGGAARLRTPGGDNSIQEFGAEAGGGEFAHAAAALHNFLDARAQRNWAAACSYLAESLHRSLRQLAARAEGIENASCAAILEKLTNPAAIGALRREAVQADVVSLRIEGDRAFLIYRGLGATVLAIPVAIEGGRWRLAALAGVPLN